MAEGSTCTCACSAGGEDPHRSAPRCAPAFVPRCANSVLRCVARTHSRDLRARKVESQCCVAQARAHLEALSRCKEQGIKRSAGARQRDDCGRGRWNHLKACLCGRFRGSRWSPTTLPPPLTQRPPHVVHNLLLRFYIAQLSAALPDGLCSLNLSVELPVASRSASRGEAPPNMRMRRGQRATERAFCPSACMADGPPAGTLGSDAARCDVWAARRAARISSASAAANTVSERLLAQHSAAPGQPRRHGLQKPAAHACGREHVTGTVHCLSRRLIPIPRVAAHSAAPAGWVAHSFIFCQHCVCVCMMDASIWMAACPQHASSGSGTSSNM